MVQGQHAPEKISAKQCTEASSLMTVLMRCNRQQDNNRCRTLTTGTTRFKVPHKITAPHSTHYRTQHRIVVHLNKNYLRLESYRIRLNCRTAQIFSVGIGALVSMYLGYQHHVDLSPGYCHPVYSGGQSNPFGIKNATDARISKVKSPGLLNLRV